MNSDLISREALKEAIIELNLDNTSHWTVIHTINNAPAVDLWQLRQEATENALKKAEVLYGRPQGKWQKVGKYACECSICGESVCGDFMNFCPNCGADMRKGSFK